MSSIVEQIEQESFYGKYQLFIDGKWRDAENGKTYEVTTPATGKKIAQCADASRQDVDAAVKAGWKAFPAWKQTSVQERSTILLKIADIIDDNREELAYLECLDNGKPIRETLNIDVPLSSDHFRYFAQVFDSIVYKKYLATSIYFI